MNLSNFYQRVINEKNHPIIVGLFFISFLIIGLFLVKDYGLSTDEPFHRTIGYYWYLSLLEKFSSNYEFINFIQNKFSSMNWADMIFDGRFDQYGPFFDFFSAIIEETLSIKNNHDAFFIKHILNFLTFFISSIFFYKIILNRFNKSNFAILITFFYISSPRIFAESFYNCKDIAFMSFCVIAIYYCLKILAKPNISNIIFFSVFAAIATDIRVMGLLLFFLLLVFLILNSFEEKNHIKNEYKYFIYLFVAYPSFVIIFWPFLWSAPLENFIYSFKSFSNYNWGGNVFYLGEFVKSSNLPWHYIPVWILATSPMIFLFFFIFGFYKTSKILFNNFISLNNTNKLWQNTNEKKDFFVLLFFLSPIFLVIIFNSSLYGGWRHLYFVYPCFIYLIGIGLNYILNIKSKIFNKNLIIYLILIGLFFNTYNLIKFHPYQNVYFNILFEKKANKLFEIDYWGLGNKEAVMYILENNSNNNSVSIKTGSYTPLNYNKLFINNDNIDKIKFTGTELGNQDYIFTNFVYEDDPKYLKKYILPKNYSKFFSLKRGNIIINEIYKKD